jgi:hypothetical protein
MNVPRTPDGTRVAPGSPVSGSTSGGQGQGIQQQMMKAKEAALQAKRNGNKQEYEYWMEVYESLADQYSKIEGSRDRRRERIADERERNKEIQDERFAKRGDQNIGVTGGVSVKQARENLRQAKLKGDQAGAEYWASVLEELMNREGSGRGGMTSSSSGGYGYSGGNPGMDRLRNRSMQGNQVVKGFRGYLDA